MTDLGTNVAALRLANRWTLKELALRVRRAGAANVRYQNIQQVERKPQTRPRYLPELAKAFGKSVEELYSWRNGDAPFGPNRPADDYVRQPFVGVRESVPETYYGSALSLLTDDEQLLVEHYRTCAPQAKNAIRVLVATCSRQTKRTGTAID